MAAPAAWRVYHDKVFVATTDAKIHALDARTGKIVWEQALGTPNNSNTGGVMVMRGKVLTGLTGCDNYSENNCYISAFDADTGKPAWRFHTTALEGEPGGDTWNGLPNLLRGGGDTWIAGHLRSGAEHDLLGRGPDQALVPRQPQDRQRLDALFLFDPGAGSRYRQAEMVLPARARVNRWTWTKCSSAC